MKWWPASCAPPCLLSVWRAAEPDHPLLCNKGLTHSNAVEVSSQEENPLVQCIKRKSRHQGRLNGRKGANTHKYIPTHTLINTSFPMWNPPPVRSNSAEKYGEGRPQQLQHNYHYSVLSVRGQCMRPSCFPAPQNVGHNAL